ncbi:RNA polymerase sigma factor [Piscinibacter sp. XHJ-5]|uniref:RNA polymerase sigma factor n=1 Tax=Piscinibacter sp. XHJ-5 TaxID=3037797 RepID=UPI0024534431|nr:RNA polymerase sigma factor [Piscinibacter sp. XHJ-5]
MNTLPTPTTAADVELDDMALARRIAEGDCAAFERLMRRHNRRLYRLARATLRDDAEAEDALQEAYLSAYRAIGRFRGEAALSTWLSRLVLNECLGRLRRGARRHNVIPMIQGSDPERIDLEAMAPAEADTPDQALGRSQMRTLLERKLDALPQAFRMVFVLRAVEEMSVEETAQCLDIPEATVRSRHFRARGLLREALAQEIDLAERDLFEFGGAHCDRVVAQVMERLRDPSPAGRRGPG